MIDPNNREAFLRAEADYLREPEPRNDDEEEQIELEKADHENDKKWSGD